MKIWKYELVVTDLQTIQTPVGAKLLSVQMQKGVCCLWVLCDEHAPKEARHIAIYGTGNYMPTNPGEYIATFQIADGALVFHAFEMTQMLEV